MGNDAKPKWVLQKGRNAVMDVMAADPSRAMADIKVACLGLAFKPDIDDLRESPAMLIAQDFAKVGCQILAVEPNIDALPQKLEGGTVSLVSLEDALAQADVVCVLVKHRAFIAAKDDILASTKLVDVVGL